MAMLNIVCHVTDPSGQTLRYTVKTETNSSVQQLADRVQSRFQQPLTKVQRNDRISNEPAHILFFDEPVEPGDEFFFGFEQLESLPKPTPPRESSQEPKAEQQAEQQSRDRRSPPMPVLVEELQPAAGAESSGERRPSPPPAVPGPPSGLSAADAALNESLTPSLQTMTIESVLRGCRKAEVIYDKLLRGDTIMPADRQQLVRTAGRWLMDCCKTRMKPTSAERAYFAREFFGKLPNFRYDIVSAPERPTVLFQKDFHNSQSRGFLDVFIYNERDRKSRAGELNRPFIPTDALVKSLKRKYSKISDPRSDGKLDEGNAFSGPFPAELSVPNESVTSLSYLDEDLAGFESRYQEIIGREFAGSNPAERLSDRWEFTIAPRIVSYVRRVNVEFYNRASEGVEQKENQCGLIALKLIPFLVKRVYKDNSKLSYLIFRVDTLDDAAMLQSMRERHDAGPVIFTDHREFRIIVMDKIIPCEQSAALALEKLLKAFYVYNLALSPMRRTLILFILTFFGISRKATSAFKEIVNCILSQP